MVGKHQEVHSHPKVATDGRETDRASLATHGGGMQRWRRTATRGRSRLCLGLGEAVALGLPSRGAEQRDMVALELHSSAMVDERVRGSDGQEGE